LYQFYNAKAKTNLIPNDTKPNPTHPNHTMPGAMWCETQVMPRFRG